MPVEDERLSYRALGLLVYVLSKPDHWRANIEHLAQQHTEGREAVRTALNELLELGYAERRRGAGDDGRFEWETWVREEPTIAQESVDGSAVDGPANDGEPAAVVSTEVAKTEEQDPDASAEDVGTLVANLDASLGEARVEALCVHLADRIAAHRGGDRPNITAAWRKAMRLLLERGPLHVDKPESMTPEHVRISIDAVFDHLATPDARGFCWADQIRSAAALRDHFVQLKQSYRRATQGSVGRGAQAIDRVVAQAARDAGPSPLHQTGREPLGLLAIEPKEQAQ